MTAPAVHRSTWRFVVAYHGARFSGWQRQDNARTVQQVLEEALATLATEPVRVRSAGRTDAGVHARGQLVSSTFSTRVPAEKMVLAAASRLPDDVAVIRADIVADGFDARRDSIAKRYVYRVHNAAAHDPLDGGMCWHVRGRLDVGAMRAAAAALVGEHDFEAFRATDCQAAHARRYVWRVDVVDDGPRLSIEVRGNAFCKNQVRIMAGTLVDVGRGRLRVDDVSRILASRDRTQAGITAPAHGLTMEEVYLAEDAARAGIPADARFPGWPPGAPDPDARSRPDSESSDTNDEPDDDVLG
jgi:tRNA pseudouridine38-40 synthase